MPRVKGSTIHRARRKKVLDEAKGYFGSKHRLYKTAKEQVMHSGKYAYRDRKQKKRDFRKLWITRINAACRENEISYSKFIDGLNKAGITINRKMLSEIAIDSKENFASLVTIAKDALNGKVEVQEKPETKEVKTASTKENKDLSSNKIEEVKNLIQDKQIKYIFSTSSKSNETVSGLIDEYHLDLVPINTMHSTDGNITSSNDNYLTIMTNNINQLKKELYK